jgi:ribosomal protein S18 acetylase RimI-like enzyme
MRRRAGCWRQREPKMTSNVHIRPFEAADLEEIQQIRALAFAPIFRSFRQIVGETISALALAQADTEQAEHLASVCAPNSRRRVYVALVDELLVGFVSFSLNDTKKIGEIGLNAVHPNHAGKGIGTTLYNFAIEQMRESWMVLATVGVGGDPSHIPAQRAYRKAGFGPSIPSIWMYRVL